jgi:hypothetical protein
VINRCRERRRIFNAIESCVASMRSKLEWLGESFDMSLS